MLSVDFEREVAGDGFPLIVAGCRQGSEVPVESLVRVITQRVEVGAPDFALGEFRDNLEAHFADTIEHHLIEPEVDRPLLRRQFTERRDAASK